MQSVNRPIQEMAAVTNSVTVDRMAVMVYPPFSQTDNPLDQADAQTDKGGDNEQQKQFVRSDGGHELANPLNALSDKGGDGGQNVGDSSSFLF